MTDEKRVEAGRHYRRRWWGGYRDAAPETPQVVICRRVVDFPRGELPAGQVAHACSRCGAAIATNPASPYTAPRICMQCGGIRPDPMPEG